MKRNAQKSVKIISKSTDRSLINQPDSALAIFSVPFTLFDENHVNGIFVASMQQHPLHLLYAVDELLTSLGGPSESCFKLALQFGLIFCMNFPCPRGLLLAVIPSSVECEPV